MGKRGSVWSYSVGERPHTVRVYEREPGGILYAAAWDPKLRDGKGGQDRQSLGHRDKARARAYAREECAKLEQGAKDRALGRVKLAEVFGEYRLGRTPQKTHGEQQADGRRIEMWTRVLGAGSDPHRISLAQWERFIRDRASGALDARGMVVEESKRQPVRARTVEADCRWLRWVFNWATKWRTLEGHYLMRENPVRGFPAPKEQNPRRPVATQDRFEAIREVSDQVLMETQWGERQTVRSYLSEILDIVHGTARRLSAVCKLTYGDLRLEEAPDAPYGWIRWPADTDKMGREMVVAITPDVRKALDRVLRERPGIGGAPLFPAPGDAQKPISRHLADRWLRKAEELAGLETQEGSLWHAYRRGWATARKHLPDPDVAAVGGWKSLAALKSAYQQADSETMLRVVLGGEELREAQ